VAKKCVNNIIPMLQQKMHQFKMPRNQHAI
jgi:hypothetical protein